MKTKTELELIVNDESISARIRQQAQEQLQKLENTPIKQEQEGADPIWLWLGLETLCHWSKDKTAVRCIGGKDTKYNDYVNELQERYPEDNIAEQVIELRKQQDVYEAKAATEHAKRQQEYALQTKEIEQEVRAYFGSAYSEDEIKRQIYYRWQRAQRTQQAQQGKI